jgi:hypothetical protein
MTGSDRDADPYLSVSTICARIRLCGGQRGLSLGCLRDLCTKKVHSSLFNPLAKWLRLG